MRASHIFQTTLCLALSLSITACSPTDVAPNPSQKPSQNTQAEDIQAARTKALANPDWAQVSNLPTSWGGLYQPDCKIGGPETLSFFNYRNADTNSQAYFNYIPFPAALNKAPNATVVPITYKVWQNKNWPDHYLLFAQNSYSQIIISEGWAKGAHQSLDGQPWDSMVNYMTKYKPSDAVRWSVDINNTEDYGSRPPCDLKLAQPWSGQVFITKSGQPYTLQQFMSAP